MSSCIQLGVTLPGVFVQALTVAWLTCGLYIYKPESTLVCKICGQKIYFKFR
jgi:hypothetical protein